VIRPNTRKVWLSVSCLLALSACVLQPANAACVGTQTGDLAAIEDLAFRDPAAALAPALRAARSARTLPVVVALIGTEADPQGWSRQADALAAAGAAVFASNAAATRYALDLLGASS